MILIQWPVHDGDLALPKRIVESIVDVGGIHAQPSSGIAIDDDGGFQAFVLLIGVDIAKLRKGPQFLQEKRRPVI